MKRVLVIGKTGQVASCLSQTDCDWAEIVKIGRPEFDLIEAESIQQAITHNKPDLVINAAAYTAVDMAEREQDLAHAINAIAAGKIAAAANKADAPVIHISTDYVFDGTSPRPYNEWDPTCPLSVYGQTKLDGEKLVEQANPRHLIVRTAWVYSIFGQNFVKSMLRLGAQHEELTIVSDQFGCPTSAHDLAEILLALGKRLCLKPNDDDYGIVHACGTGIASWYDFSKTVFANPKTPDPTVVPIETKDFPTPAKRPANSRLDITRLETHFGLVMPQWNKSVEWVLSNLSCR